VLAFQRREKKKAEVEKTREDARFDKKKKVLGKKKKDD